MLQTDVKLSLYIKINGDPIFSVDGDPFIEKINDDEIVYHWSIDPRKVTEINVNGEKFPDGSYIRPLRMIYGDKELPFLDQFGMFRPKSGGHRKTWGYLDEPGTYTYKIRYNKSTHAFLTYLINSKT